MGLFDAAAGESFFSDGLAHRVLIAFGSDTGVRVYGLQALGLIASGGIYGPMIWIFPFGPLSRGFRVWGLGLRV